VTKKAPATTSNETFAQFAGHALDLLSMTLISFEKGAATGDVEAVHAMRVSTRRLRVGLSNFAVCLSKDFRRRVKRDLNALADTLGRVRDLDVMVEALNQLQLEQPISRRATIVKMRARLRTRRTFHAKRLSEYLRSEEYSNLKQLISSIPAAIEAEVENNGQTIQSQKDNAA
jgi:CHAD domain-containing protein